MNKNSVIVYLGIIITILVGIIIITNTNLFSEEWLIGLGIVLGGIGIASVLVYFKMVR